MKYSKRGFTLIELVLIVIILGVIAVVAMPKFTDFQKEAKQATVASIAGSLASASSINFSTSLAKGQKYGADLHGAHSFAVDTSRGCNNDTARALLNGSVVFALRGAGTYSVTGTPLPSNDSDRYDDVGDKQLCALKNNATGQTATFVLYATK